MANPYDGTVLSRGEEDVGIGMVRARIEFKSPTEMGMSSDALDDHRVGHDRVRLRGR